MQQERARALPGSALTLSAGVPQAATTPRSTFTASGYDRRPRLRAAGEHVESERRSASYRNGADETGIAIAALVR